MRFARGMVRRCGRSAALAGAAIAAGLATAAAAAPAAGGADAKRFAALKQIGAAIDRHDCAGVTRLGEPMIAAGDLPPGMAAILESLLGSCAYDAGDHDKAYAHLQRATAVADAPDQFWLMRLWLEIEDKRNDAAIATVEMLGRSRMSALNAAPVAMLSLFSRQLKEQGLRAERKRLLKVLAGGDYAPADWAGNAQAFRLDYAHVLADDGEASAAGPYLGSISDGRMLSEIYVDPRLRTALPAGFDLRTAAEAGLARDRQAAQEHPDSLILLIQVATDLRRLGRAEEAISLLESASPRLADPRFFRDRAAQLPWYWDTLARSKASLARYDSAVAAFSAGAALNEGSSPNVSQVINLAFLQVLFHHGEDALKTLAVFDQPGRKGSPYGEMELRTVRVCARSVAGTLSAASGDIGYAEAHEKDNPDALGYLYLCLDRMDDAAAFFIRRLADPETRTEILLQLSDFDAPPGPVPGDFDARLARLKARPDLKTALDAAGGIRRIPLQSDGI